MSALAAAFAVGAVGVRATDQRLGDNRSIVCNEAPWGEERHRRIAGGVARVADLHNRGRGLGAFRIGEVRGDEAHQSVRLANEYLGAGWAGRNAAVLRDGLSFAGRGSAAHAVGAVAVRHIGSIRARSKQDQHNADRNAAVANHLLAFVRLAFSSFGFGKGNRS